MPATQRASDSELLSAYAELGSVHKVGARFGIRGSSVHERLQKLGYSPQIPRATLWEKQIIAAYYGTTTPASFSLTELANKLGRPRTSVARWARELGLTNKRRSVAESARQNMRKACVGRWLDKPHPRGMLGKPQTARARKAVGEASRKKWATDKAFGIGHMSEEARQARSDRSTAWHATAPASSNYSRVKSGPRADLGGLFVRSSWEANYARYLNLLKQMGLVVGWEYEPETFWFEPIKRGVRSYRPDFRVFYKGDERPTYVEVKGWFDAKSKTKLKRMKKYHPHIMIDFVGAKEYRALKIKWRGAIPTWE